jgi:DNA-binding response OmpR family regulator
MEKSERLKVLVVEDDRETREFIERALAEDGLAVDTHGRIGELRAVERIEAAAAVVLDVALPDANGIEMCRAWRAAGARTPILILTAHADVASRVAGLDAGADDYLGKPFALAELRARVRALLRRGPRAASERVLRHGSVVVDFQRRRAWVAGAEVPLTKREIDLLERLAQGQGHAVSRNELLQDVWGDSSAEAAASLEVILARLRRKLVGSSKAGLIRTVRGYGYALTVAGGDVAE